MFCHETYTVLEKYRAFLLEKKECIRDSVLQEIELLNINENADEARESIIIKLKTLLKKLKIEQVDTNYIGLDNIIFKTTFEKHVSDTYFVEMLMEYFKRLNYKVTLLDEEERDRFEEKEEKEKDSPRDYLGEFDEIKVLTGDGELKELNQKIGMSKDLPGDKLRVEKFYFLVSFNWQWCTPINKNRIAMLFFEVYRKSIPKKIFDNVFEEHRRSPLHTQLQVAFAQSEGQVSRYEMNAQKLQHINKINECLGLVHSQDTETIIDKVHFDAGCIYVLKNFRNILFSFLGPDALDQSKKAEKNNKDASNLITSIYEGWSGMTLSRTKTKATNKTKTNKHSLEPMKNMVVFIDLFKVPKDASKEQPLPNDLLASSTKENHDIDQEGLSKLS